MKCEGAHFQSITYDGTISEWNLISGGLKTFGYFGSKIIHCDDGDVTLT